MRGAEELGQAWRMSSLGDFFPWNGWIQDGWHSLYVGEIL